MSFYTLGISFLMRAVGDVSCEALSRFSPLGLAQRAQPWVSNQLWPIVLMVIAALVFFAVAFVLNSRRDTGAGLIAERSGRRHASPFLRNELGLAFRLTRATCLAWILAMFVLGLMVGAIFNDMAGFFTTNELYRQLIGIGVTDEETLIKTFIEFIMLIMTVLSAIPVCQVVLRCVSEEHHGRTEQLYGLAVSRFRMLGCHWIISLGLAVVIQLTLAIGVYISALPTSDTPPQLSMLLSTTMCYVPALLVFSGLAVALCGLLPRASAAVWVFIAYNFLMQYLGNMLSLPEFARKLSPLEWVKPGSEPAAFVGVGLFGLFAAVVGLLAYRRRDLSG
jgi:ABC-2 type transport system permease protein